MEKFGLTGEAISDSDDHIFNKNQIKNDKRFGDNLQSHKKRNRIINVKRNNVL